MTKGKSHISKNDIHKYLNDEMSEKERNAFERLLEKNPFEAEAIEGIQLIGEKAFYDDLEELKDKFKPGKKRRLIWYRVAAVALLLIISSTVFYQLNKVQKDSQIVQHFKADTLQEEIVPKSEMEQVDELELEVDSEELSVTEEIIVEEDAVVLEKENPKVKELDEIYSIVESDQEEDESKIDIAELAKKEPVILSQPESRQVIIRGASQNDVRIRAAKILDESLGLVKKDSTLKFVRGVVINKDDKQPIPGASIFIRGTDSGTITNMDGEFLLKTIKDTSDLFVASFVGMESVEFAPSDSKLVIEMQPDELALSEVVAVGYGAQKSASSTKGVDSVINKKAMPQIGFAAYQDYLDEQSIISDTLNVKKDVVRVQISVNKSGLINDIVGLNNPDSILFENVRKIILEGPKWNPEIKDNVPVDSGVKLRIKFRK